MFKHDVALCTRGDFIIDPLFNKAELILQAILKNYQRAAVCVNHFPIFIAYIDSKKAFKSH